MIVIKVISDIWILESADSEPFFGYVIVDGNKILDVESGSYEGKESEDLQIYRFDEYHLLMPGFSNTHSHLGMSIFRGVSDDADLKEWLFKEILPRENLLNYDIVFYASTISMMEMLSKGITSVVDMYFYMDAVVEAAKRIGIRLFATRGLAFDTKEGWERRIKENMDLYEKYNGYDDLIYVGFGPHSPYLCPTEKLKELVDEIEGKDTFITIHILESEWEKENTDLKGLEKIGFFNLPVLVAHGVHLSKEDMEILARNNISVAHNPSSNLKLGNGIAPVMEMIHEGINVTLGTDGAASNNSLDIWQEMRLAALLQKSKYPKKFKTVEVLRMAWENAGFALNKKIGRIEPGYYADLVVIRLDTFDFMPFDLERIKSHLVYSASSKNVVSTMVNGEWVYRDGIFTRIEESDIIDAFHKYYDYIEKRYKKESSNSISSNSD